MTTCFYSVFSSSCTVVFWILIWVDILLKYQALYLCDGCFVEAVTFGQVVRLPNARGQTRIPAKAAKLGNISCPWLPRSVCGRRRELDSRREGSLCVRSRPKAVTTPAWWSRSVGESRKPLACCSHCWFLLIFLLVFICC